MLQEMGEVVKTLQQIRLNCEAFEQYKADHKQQLDYLSEQSDEILGAFIVYSLDEKRGKVHNLKGLELQPALEKAFAPNGYPREPEYEPLLTRALDYYSRYKVAYTIPDGMTPTATPTPKIDYLTSPLDKFTGQILKGIDRKQGAAETSLRLYTSNQTSIYGGINYEALDASNKPVMDKIDSYDLLVSIALAALWDKGKREGITTDDIYNILTGGKKRKPNADQERRIAESFEKQSTLRITLDNTEEAAKYRPTIFRANMIEGRQYVCRALRGKKAGQYTYAYKLHERPAVIEYAARRGQFTTINAGLLDIIKSLTPRNIHLFFYTLQRIAHAKHDVKELDSYRKQLETAEATLKAEGKKDTETAQEAQQSIAAAETNIKRLQSFRKISYETLYRELQIGNENRMEKKRARDTLGKYLDSLAERGEIRGHTATADGEIIDIDETGARLLSNSTTPPATKGKRGRKKAPAAEGPNA